MVGLIDWSKTKNNSKIERPGDPISHTKHKNNINPVHIVQKTTKNSTRHTAYTHKTRIRHMPIVEFGTPKTHIRHTLHTRYTTIQHWTIYPNTAQDTTYSAKLGTLREKIKKKTTGAGFEPRSSRIRSTYYTRCAQGTAPRTQKKYNVPLKLTSSLKTVVAS
jgi:hypothetical protein